MQIVRQLAAEGNPIAKIAFLTRLAESTVREILGLHTEQESRRRLPVESHPEGFFPAAPNLHWEPCSIAA